MGFSETQLDRLLESYDISIREQYGYGARDQNFDLASSRERLLYKLTLLLDFLGARQIASVLRSGSGSDWSGSRQPLIGSFR